MESNSDLVVILPESTTSTRAQRIRQLCRITLEPVLFLIFFGMSFTSAVSQSFIIQLTCTTIFGHNETVCEQMISANATAEVEEIKSEVQRYASQMFMVSSVAGTVGPALSSIFVGAWSDKYGRKPLLLICLSGFFLSSVINTFLAFLSTAIQLNPWIFTLSIIPTSLGGGYCSLLGGTFCYIADISTEKQRPMKIALLGAYISLGMFLGSLASGYAFEALSVPVILAISSANTFIALMYLVMFVPESLDHEKLQTTSRFKGLFQWALVKDMIHTLAKRRHGYNRMIVLICITVLCVTVFILEGSLNIFLLYVTKQFSWTIKELTTFNAISTVVSALGATFTIILLQKILDFSPVTVILIGLGSNFLECVVRAAATQTWHMYFGLGISVAKGAALSTIRSLIATVVPTSEVGKIYSITTSLEFLLPIGSAPLYTYVYNATLDTFTGAFNIISAALVLFTFVLFTIIFGLEVRYPSIMNKPVKE